jgi:hypothetical protein
MLYGAVQGLWPVEELAQLANGPTGCSGVARGGCLCQWNFSVTRSNVLTQAERTSPNTTLSPHWLIALILRFENPTGQKPCTALYLCVACLCCRKREWCKCDRSGLARSFCAWSAASKQWERSPAVKSGHRVHVPAPPAGERPNA